MRIVKYIIKCIFGCFDALVGRGTDITFKDGMIGLVSILIFIILFFLSFIILDKKTNISFKINLICSLGITMFLISIVFLFLIIIENLYI